MVKGKTVKEREIGTPFGKVILTEKEYPPFVNREEVIYWLGEMKCIELGKLVTVLHPKRRKSDFEPIQYEPLYYTIKWNESADLSKVQDYYAPELIAEGELEFDTKDEAMKFIEGMLCKTVKQGSTFTDSRKKFEWFKSVLDKALQEL